MTPETGGGPVRQRVVYAGRVQGVCFRAISQDIARRFRVVGYVRNLSDGSVELEAEGSPAEVQRYLDAVQAHFRSHITDARRSAVQIRQDETHFEIRY